MVYSAKERHSQRLIYECRFIKFAFVAICAPDLSSQRVVRVYVCVCVCYQLCKGTMPLSSFFPPLSPEPNQHSTDPLHPSLLVSFFPPSLSSPLSLSITLVIFLTPHVLTADVCYERLRQTCLLFLCVCVWERRVIASNDRVHVLLQTCHLPPIQKAHNVIMCICVCVSGSCGFGR